MAEVIDYSKLLPTEPPEGMLSWMRDKGCFGKEFIIYKSAYYYNPLTGINESVAECRCSSCKETFYMPKVYAPSCSHAAAPAPFGFKNNINGHAENVISGDSTLCPSCGAKVRLYYVGQIRWRIDIENHFPMTVHKIGNRLALLSWNVNRKLYKDGTTEIITNPWEAYVIEDRKIVRLTGYKKFMSSVSLLGEWEQRKKYIDAFGKTLPQHIFPFNQSVLDGTTAENCKLDLYCTGCGEVAPVTYMYLWLKHKNVENLIMQGMEAIVDEKILKLFGYYSARPSSINEIRGINWKESKPYRMLGISKEAFRFAKKKKWGVEKLEFYKQVSEYGVKPEDVEAFKRHEYYSIERLCDYKANITKSMRYIDRQNGKYPNQRKATINELVDYWNMTKELKENLSDENVKYPQNLIRAHDTAVSRIEFKKSEKLRIQFEGRYEQLSKYIYTNGELEIRPAASHAELIAEGKILHHCVGSYAKRHAEGDTAIFFIRHVSAPESPFFTLELDEKELVVRQNRGRGNCARTEEVKEFEAEWLEHIKKIDKESKNNGKHKKRPAA